MRHVVCTLLLWLLTTVPVMASPPIEVRDSVLLLSAIDLKVVGEVGDSMLWNFSEASLGKHPGKLYLLADSLGLPSAVFSGTHYHLSVHSDTLMLRGMEDKSLRITYSLRPVLLVAPLHYGSTQTGTLLGSGVYCDRLHLRFTGIISSRLTLRVNSLHLMVIPCVQFAYTYKMFTMFPCPRSILRSLLSGKSGLSRTCLLGTPSAVLSPLSW